MATKVNAKAKAKKNTEKNNEFAPCPFCGEDRKIALKVDAWLLDTGENFPKYYVVCDSCGCKTSRYVRAEAISHWNRRVRGRNATKTA